ncbi:DUF4233 domain-containing protein [Bowdeniella massiliensis]|uniref:DUF4233 domain-containing protein n=1 Tax=Bowdeniella massiliensis TaxID=2932264 RepID=UPI0020294FA9
MTAHQPPATGAPQPRNAPAPPRSARYLFCVVLLVLEAFVALFLALVLYGLRIVDGQSAALIGGVVAALALLAAGLLRTRAGLIVGTGVQVALLASGFWLGDMFALGVIFAVLWGVSVYLGTKIDRERAERYAAEIAHMERDEGTAAGAPGSIA